MDEMVGIRQGGVDESVLKGGIRETPLHYLSTAAPEPEPGGQGQRQGYRVLANPRCHDVPCIVSDHYYSFKLSNHEDTNRMHFDSHLPGEELRHFPLLIFEAKRLEVDFEQSGFNAVFATEPYNELWVPVQRQAMVQASVRFGENPYPHMRAVVVAAVGRWWRWNIFGPGVMTPLHLTRKDETTLDWIGRNTDTLVSYHPLHDWSFSYEISDTPSMDALAAYTSLLDALMVQVKQKQ